jgi:predicted DNA-binding transcriptional regulator AlpA
MAGSLTPNNQTKGDTVRSTPFDKYLRNGQMGKGFFDSPEYEAIARKHPILNKTLVVSLMCLGSHEAIQREKAGKFPLGFKMQRGLGMTSCNYKIEDVRRFFLENPGEEELRVKRILKNWGPIKLNQRTAMNYPKIEEGRTEYLSAPQVAELLNIKPETVRKWRQLKKGPPAVKIGACVRYRQADLNAWVDSLPRNGW